jgi:CTP:molybdopterin cytidylyltransferase MocA
VSGGPLAVVLAAGGGTRFQGATHKLLAPFRGRPVVAWAAGAPVAAGLPTLVVTGAVDVGEALAGLPVELVANPRWAQGQATSLAVAVAVARAAGRSAVVVGLGDQPLLEASAWRAVADADGAPIAVAAYGGRRGQPVRLGAEVWDDLPPEGDEGARRLVAAGRWPVQEVACDGEPADIDTQEDLRRWS